MLRPRLRRGRVQHSLSSWLPTTHIRRPAEMHLRSLIALAPGFPPEKKKKGRVKGWISTPRMAVRMSVGSRTARHSPEPPTSTAPWPWAGPGEHTQTHEGGSWDSDFPHQKERNSHLPHPSFLATGYSAKGPQHQRNPFGEKQGVSPSNFCKKRLQQFPSWAINPK